VVSATHKGKELRCQGYCASCHAERRELREGGRKKVRRKGRRRRRIERNDRDFKPSRMQEGAFRWVTWEGKNSKKRKLKKE